MNLRSFDLNLLLVFEAIFRERSVLRASQSLALSQPAVSHALNRLRYLLNDGLFVRTPNGMIPTPRAEELALPVRRALSEIRFALEGLQFDPSTANRRFAIAVNNYAAVVLAGPIIAACRAQAPGICLTIRPSGTLMVTDLLDRGELDLVISAADLQSERFASHSLLRDRYVAVLRRGHPALQKKLTISTLAKLPHLAITSSGEDLSFVDSALAVRGTSRTIALEVPYLSAGSALVQSNMVAILSRKLALEFRRAYPIEIRDLPFDVAELQSIMLWHRRFDSQPAHLWLRETILATAQAL
jgi:DNA-binding transcriptional LysR family regulator